MRKLFLIVVAVVTLMHSLTLVGQAAGLSTSDDFAHTVLHWDDTRHHHDDEGGWQVEDSDQARQHVTLDDGLAAPALCSTPYVALLAPPARGHPRPADVVALMHEGDGLRRPPRRFL